MGSLATSKNLTVVGIATIIGAIAAILVPLFDGDATTLPQWEISLTALMAGIGMIMGKGSASTGGTVAETPEAEHRVVADMNKSTPKGALLVLVLALAASGFACATAAGLSGGAPFDLGNGVTGRVEASEVNEACIKTITVTALLPNGGSTVSRIAVKVHGLPGCP
jgi:hypothetical protein